MAIVPTDPSPGPTPVPDLPPIGEPTPPIKEPEPDRLPDEEPNPNRTKTMIPPSRSVRGKHHSTGPRAEK